MCMLYFKSACDLSHAASDPHLFWHKSLWEGAHLREAGVVGSPSEEGGGLGSSYLSLSLQWGWAVGARAGMGSPGCLQQHPKESCRVGEIRALVLGLSDAAWQCTASGTGCAGPALGSTSWPHGSRWWLWLGVFSKYELLSLSNWISKWIKWAGKLEFKNKK